MPHTGGEVQLVQLVNQAGNTPGGLAVGGETAGGFPPTGKNPVFVGGWDGTNIHGLLTDSNGALRVTGTITNVIGEVDGTGAEGAVPVGNPVRCAGWDGTNTRTIKTDSSGRSLAVGAVANGAVTAGSPVLIGASDGTNTFQVLCDNTGRLQTTNTAVVTPQTADTVVTQPNGGITVTSANTAVLAANLTRLGIQIVNTGNTGVTLTLGTTASSLQGIWLGPNGGEWNGLVSGALWLGSVNAITASGSSIISLVEV